MLRSHKFSIFGVLDVGWFSDTFLWKKLSYTPKNKVLLKNVCLQQLFFMHSLLWYNLSVESSSEAISVTLAFPLYPTVPSTLIEYLHETLPLSCDLVVVSATGIIGTVETAYQGHWVECAQNMNQEILDFIEGAEDKPQRRPFKRARKEKAAENALEAGEEAKVACEAWKSNVGYSIEVEQNSPAMTDADAVSLLIIPYHPGVKVQFFDISPEKFYSDYVSVLWLLVWFCAVVCVFQSL